MSFLEQTGGLNTSFRGHMTVFKQNNNFLRDIIVGHLHRKTKGLTEQAINNGKKNPNNS